MTRTVQNGEAIPSADGRKNERARSRVLERDDGVCGAAALSAHRDSTGRVEAFFAVFSGWRWRRFRSPPAEVKFLSPHPALSPRRGDHRCQAVRAWTKVRSHQCWAFTARWRRGLALALLAIWTVSIPTMGAEKTLIRTRLKLGANQTNFLNVNRNDAQAAIKAFAITVGEKRGYAVEPEIEIYDTTAAYAKGILEQGVQLAVMDTWDYLSIDPISVMEPLFVFLEPGGPLEPYLLLALRDKGASALTELRGQEILVLENTNCNLSQQWLETLLLEQNLGGVPEFFKKAEVVNKASAAVLPVFFGRRAACIVDQSAFQLMSELNPQVGRRLQTIAMSKPYLDTILCVRREGWQTEQERKDLIASLEELDQSPEGQQILTVFKVSKLEPFKEEQLTTVKELKATHDRLIRAGQSGANPSKEPSSQGKDAP